MRAILIRSAWVLLLAAAGCGDGRTSDDIPQVPGATTGAEPDQIAPTVEPEADVVEIEAVLTEWDIALTQDSVRSGAVMFEVRNAGTAPHAFEVEGGGEEWVTDPLEPGDEVTMSVVLEPGVYEVYCPVDSGGVNHRARGMTTRLHVY